MKKLISLPLLLLVYSNVICQSILYMNPPSSDVDTTLTVGISGRCTHFFQTSSTSSIFWLANGSNIISSVSVNASSNTFMSGIITVPAGATLGFWDLYAYNSIDDTIKLTNAFEVYDCNITPPTALSLLPNNSAVNNNLTVNISGRCTNFYQTSTTTTTFWLVNGSNIITPSSVSSGSNTNLSGGISVPSNAAIGLWDLYIYNNVDDTIVLTNAFEVVDCNVTSPSLVTVFPDASPTSNNLTVNISGRCTNFYQTSPTTSTFWLAKGGNTITPSSVNTSSNTAISGGISVPSGAALGFWDVYVYNSIDDTLVLPSGFEIYACPPTGILERKNGYNISISAFPNPFNNSTNFMIQGVLPGQAFTFYLYNLVGQPVKRVNNIRSPSFQIHRDQLPNGVYFYRIESNDGMKGMGKIIITD